MMRASDALDAAASILVHAAEQVPGDSPAEQAAWVTLFAVIGGIVVTCTLAGIVWKVVRPHVDKYLTRLIASVESKVDDIHRETTVNGGKNNPPTTKDEVGATLKEVRALRSDVSEVRAEVSGVRADLEEHESASGRYLGQVTLVLAEHGIQLPMPKHDDERPDERPDL